MEKLSSTTQSSTTLTKITLFYLNALRMLFSVLILLHQTLPDPIIYSIQTVLIVNLEPTLTLMLQIQTSWDGLAVVEISYVPVITIILFTTIQVLSCQRKVFC